MKFVVPKSVVIKETAARDGFQNEKHVIPTQEKIRSINSCLEAGFKQIEVTSFSNPRNVPQFADAEEVLKGIIRKPEVVYWGTTVTKRAVERAVAATEKGYGINMTSWMVSTSESHVKKNCGQSSTERFALAKTMLQMMRGAGMNMCGAVTTVFGCPMEGPIPIQRAIEFTDKFIDLGFDWILHGDTTGEGTPNRVFDYFSMILDRYPRVTHIAHFHESRGWGLANCLAALQAGISNFDSSMGGLGGQPAHIVDDIARPGTGPAYTPSDITGNVRSEDLIVMLDEMGIETGLDVDRVLDIGRFVEKVVGRRLKSYCVETGRIPKGPTGL